MKDNLQIQCNIYQNTKGVFHRTRNNPKICMEPQKTSNSQSNLEKEEQSWWYHSLCFQTVLQSYNNQKQYGNGTKTET